MICIIFSTIYVYNSSEFIELLVSQPLQRRTIWLSLFVGLSVSLSIAFLIGIGLPILIYQPNSNGVYDVADGAFANDYFCKYCHAGCGLLPGIKPKELAFAILLWLYFSLIFDALFYLFYSSSRIIHWKSQ